jgi:LacI family transcriptional regulator
VRSNLQNRLKSESFLSTQKRQAPTIHDVAHHAGVSSMTASRVVNGYAHVRPAVRTKVEESIKALGYRPNSLARATRTGVTQIGMLYSNAGSSNLSNYLMGAFRQASLSGCQLLIEPSQAHPTPAQAVRKLIDAGVGAIILPPPLCDDEDILATLASEGVGAVSFATALPRDGVPAVFIDDFEGVRTMTQHLLDLGHVDIAFIGGDPTHSTAQRREQAFRETMAAAGVEVREEYMAEGGFSYRGGLDAARHLLSLRRRPSAIFAANDDMAAAASAVAQGLGLSIPGDVSIAGFDDTSVATTVWPELTTIRQPIADMAASAVLLAMDLAKSGADPGSHVKAELQLMSRASTAPPHA